MQERRFNSPRRELMQNLIKLLNANIFGLHYFGRSTCPPAKVCFRCFCVRLLCNLAVGGGIGAGRREGRVDGGWGWRGHSLTAAAGAACLKTFQLLAAFFSTRSLFSTSALPSILFLHPYLGIRQALPHFMWSLLKICLFQGHL